MPRNIPTLETVVTCENCGIKFNKANKELARTEHNFCSRDCSEKHTYKYALGTRKSKQVAVECAYCGTTFTRSPSKIAQSKSGLQFCSREHKDLAQRLDSSIKEIRPAHYDSGITIYRQKAIEYYGAVCEQCGYSEREICLDVHHIDGNRSNNNLDNLVVLCATCHSWYTRTKEMYRR